MTAHPFSELEFELPEEGLPALDGFVLQGRPFVPEGVLVELLLSNHGAQGGRRGCLTGLLFHRPVYCSNNAHRLCSNGLMVRLESQGRLELCSLFDLATQSPHAARRRVEDLVDPNEFGTVVAPYERLAMLGYLAAPAYRCLDGVRLGEHQAQGTIKLSAAGAHVPAASLLLEGALQLARLLLADRGSRVASIDCATVLGFSQLDSVRAIAALDDAGLLAVDLLDDSGERIGALRGISLVSSDAPPRRAAFARQLELVVQREFERSPKFSSHLVSEGWTSLDLVRLLNSLTLLWGHVPEPASLRERPTLDELVDQARALLDQQHPAPTAWLTDFAADEGQLSRSELRLWYLERYAGVAPAYNQAVRVTLPVDLRREVLLQRIEQLISAQPALRTTIDDVGGQPRRIIAPHVPLNDVLEERQVAAEDLAGFVQAFARRPFDLARGPLFRLLWLSPGSTAQELVIVAHHVICDGWTLTEILVPALLMGQESSHRAPFCTMGDFASWETAALSHDLLKVALDHGRGLVGDAPTTFELPTDLPRPAIQSHCGATLRESFTCSEREAVIRIAQEQRVTPFAALFAAAATVLGRLAGEETFLVGIPVAVRQGMEFQGTAGCLVNTLPVRVDLTGEPGFGDVCQRVSQAVIETLKVPHLPLDALVADLAVPRDLSRNPLLQVCIAYRESATPLPSGCQVCEVDTKTAKFDVTLYFTKEGDRLSIAVEYATDLFSAERMELLVRQVRSTLSVAAQDAEVPVWEEGLLDVAERTWLSRHGRGTSALVVPSLAALSPLPATFWLHGTGRTFDASYLEGACKALTARIVEHSGGRPCFVGIACERSPLFVVALVSVLRAGAAYVPIDVRSPVVRALATLAAVSAQLLVHDGSADVWDERFSGRSLRLPEIDALHLTVPHAPFQASLAEQGGLPVYGISTSGSTGEPKVAVVTRRGASNLLAWYKATLRCDAHDVIYVVTSPSFDLTQKNFLLAIEQGCGLVLHPEEAFDPQHVCQGIDKARATVLNCTPSMFEALLDHAGRDGYRALTSLRCVILGGEPLYADRLQTFLQSPACKARILNSYGPSEASDVVTAYEVDPQKDSVGPVPIGHPIGNVTLRVERAGGLLCSLGATGELCIRGAAVGAGYASDGDVVPFDDGDQPTYRTGDLVRFRMDGALLFMGRRDGQTKLRGQRLELGEVEAVFAKHPDLRAAAANVVLGPAGQALVLFYVAQRAVAGGVLRAFGAEALPTVMVPSFYVRLGTLPRTRTGKLDRRALQLPQDHLRAHGIEGAAPRTPIEAKIVAAFQEVLGLSQVGRDDDFFMLGGHSLLAVALADRLQEDVGCACRPADLVRFPTPAALARHLDKQALLA